MAETTEVVIVGAGIIGCSIARELAKVGIKSVVVDASGVGTEASWAAAGVITHSNPGKGPYSRLRRIGHRYFCKVIEELQDDTSLDLGFEKTGSLEAVFTDEEEFEAAKWDVEYVKCELPREKLSRDEALAREPMISNDIISSRYQPNDFQVRNTRLSRAMAESAEKMGVTFRLHTRVERLLSSGSRVTGVATADGDLHAERTILAAGAWSAVLARTVSIELPLFPVKGQMALLQGPPGLLKHIIKGNAMYCVPRPDGRIAVGATIEDDAGFDKRVTAEGMRSVLATAHRLSPELQKLPVVHQWAGLRPYAAKKGGPLLGEYAGVDGLLIATGHYRNGILLGPVTGLFVKELILGEKTSIDLTAFRPDR